MITVSISKALICIAGQCFPALVGSGTPSGEFQMQIRKVEASGYGGEVIQFKETDRYVYAIHRVWNGKPEQRRADRLSSGDAADRVITSGCINVSDGVYDAIRAGRYGATLRIEK